MAAQAPLPLVSQCCCLLLRLLSVLAQVEERIEALPGGLLAPFAPLLAWLTNTTSES
jgi:hypothetical protein